LKDVQEVKDDDELQPIYEEDEDNTDICLEDDMMFNLKLPTVENKTNKCFNLPEQKVNIV